MVKAEDCVANLQAECFNEDKDFYVVYTLLDARYLNIKRKW